MKCCAPCAWWWTPGCTPRAGRREQAIRYMLDNSSMAESDVVAEVERYIVWPGQALGYKLGQLRITALRARAQAALGDGFDVREFHSQVLRDGARAHGRADRQDRPLDRGEVRRRTA